MSRLESLHHTSRVLDNAPIPSLDDYRSIGGGLGLDVARDIEPEALIGLISESGLRGRGGSGFPTGLKWATVAASESITAPTTVVINAAEGEPGTFKDRAILRRNPYRVLEGAAIAAHAVDAKAIRIGIKATFNREIRLLDHALTEAIEAGWFDDIDIAMVLGAGYLFGEETAMLEVIEGRQPFPRVAPPFRRGIDDDDPTRSAAGLEMASIGGSTEPPALVDNVETLSNVPLIVTNGSEWFRRLGTEKSPGTIVVTVSGDTNRAGVGEVPMGTTLRDAIDLIGWGVRNGREVGLVLGGTANAMLTAEALDTPLTYEDMAAAGSGLGSGGFIVFDDRCDPVAVAQGVSRFLAVESCGQCEHCKLDGTELSMLLQRLSASKAHGDDLTEIRRRQATVSIGARCNLARQQEAVVGSLLQQFPDSVEGHHMEGTTAKLPAVNDVPLIAPIIDIVGGTATIDSRQASKQLDWSYGTIDSGASPAARFGDTPFLITEPVGYERDIRWPAPGPADRIHPLDQVDEVHNEIDALVHDLIHGGSAGPASPTERLVHLAKVHIDVTQRILYPTVRRHCGRAGDELVDHATATESDLLAMLNRADAVVDDDESRAEFLRAFCSTLRVHTADEEEMFNLLDEVLDQQDKKVLLDALVEANTTSLV